jgi:hypothetical protein
MTDDICLVCPHVLDDERPVRVLIHHGDGTWQAVCGESDHATDFNDFQTVCVRHLFDRQKNLLECEAMGQDYIAEWEGGRWKVSCFQEDEPD